MSKNTFDGLRFRIQETLAKQPGQAPLTAAEIAARLHATEYRNEMRDNVVFKVTRAVHSMKEAGQVILSDARGSRGELAYQLPQRLTFPPKPEEKPPVNPVISAEIGEQIKTAVEVAAEVRKAAEPPRKEGRNRIIVPGIVDMVKEFIDKSDHPLTTLDLVAGLSHLYKAHGFSERHTTMLFAGHLHRLWKGKRIQRRHTTVKGQKLRFEYFTKRTGKNPHPKAQPTVAEPKVNSVAAMPKAPEPEVNSKPAIAKAPPPKETIRRVGGFRPQTFEATSQVMHLRIPTAQHEQIVGMAKTFGLSLNEFCIQALNYALENIEP